MRRDGSARNASSGNRVSQFCQSSPLPAGSGVATPFDRRSRESVVGQAPAGLAVRTAPHGRPPQPALPRGLAARAAQGARPCSDIPIRTLPVRHADLTASRPLAMDSSLSSRPQTQRLPRDVQGWAALFDVAALPVLADTAAEIEALRANEDAVDAHRLSQALEADPLMTLKVMSHVGMLRRGRDNGEPETLTAALVMMGISPFFRQFGPQPTVEDRLAGSATALHGFQAVLRRSHRAAVFATGFAVQRLDHDVSVIHLATLLHDFAELLLWLHAPWAATEILRRKRADPQLRTAEAEQDVLGITLPQLQHALMLRWRLPQLLSRITDDTLHNDVAQTRNVVLAVQLARHTEHGWHNPALPDDIREIAKLLNLRIEPTHRLLLELNS